MLPDTSISCEVKLINERGALCTVVAMIPGTNYNIKRKISEESIGVLATWHLFPKPHSVHFDRQTSENGKSH